MPPFHQLTSSRAPGAQLSDFEDWNANRLRAEAHGNADYGSLGMNAMRMDKDFVGKDAAQAYLDGDLRWVRAYLSIEPNGKADGNGGDAVLLDGEMVERPRRSLMGMPPRQSSLLLASGRSQQSRGRVGGCDHRRAAQNPCSGKTRLRPDR